MIKTAKQFEPDAQMDNAIGELVSALNDAAGAIERLSRLKSVLSIEIEQRRAERDALEIYTEEEAAMLLRLDSTSPTRAKKHLADLRRRLSLPHVSFGNKPRYTKRHLMEICSILEINSKAKSRLQGAL